MLLAALTSPAAVPRGQAGPSGAPLAPEFASLKLGELKNRAKRLGAPRDGGRAAE